VRIHKDFYRSVLVRRADQDAIAFKPVEKYLERLGRGGRNRA
jgi:hypothetical protein